MKIEKIIQYIALLLILTGAVFMLYDLLDGLGQSILIKSKGFVIFVFGLLFLVIDRKFFQEKNA